MAPRKRRSDAGQRALTLDEAKLISAALMETTRKNGKRLYSVADAVETLRANGMIRAEYLDTATGELRWRRALKFIMRTATRWRHYRNIWQIPATISTVFPRCGMPSPGATARAACQHTPTKLCWLTARSAGWR